MAGITDLNSRYLEAMYLVRRDPNDIHICLDALILAHKNNLTITFRELYDKHFGGRDVVKLVQDMINEQSVKPDEVGEQNIYQE